MDPLFTKREYPFHDFDKPALNYLHSNAIHTALTLVVLRLDKVSLQRGSRETQRQGTPRIETIVKLDRRIRHAISTGLSTNLIEVQVIALWLGKDSNAQIQREGNVTIGGIRRY